MRYKGYMQSQNRVLDACPTRQALEAPKDSRCHKEAFPPLDTGLYLLELQHPL